MEMEDQSGNGQIMVENTTAQTGEMTGWCRSKRAAPRGKSGNFMRLRIARKNLPTRSCKNCLERSIELTRGNIEERWNARFY
jgi:hypothetical protein